MGRAKGNDAPHVSPSVKTLEEIGPNKSAERVTHHVHVGKARPCGETLEVAVYPPRGGSHVA